MRAITAYAKFTEAIESREDELNVAISTTISAFKSMFLSTSTQTRHSKATALQPVRLSQIVLDLAHCLKTVFIFMLTVLPPA